MIRRLRREDVRGVARLHEAMGMDYRFPDFGGLYPVKNVAEHRGNLVGAMAVKAIGEAFVWIDPASSLRQKVETIVQLSIKCEEDTKVCGFEDVTAWIPPEIEPRFAHLLGKLGFEKSPWPTWTKRLL